MMMPGRKYSAQSNYRYGFNGKENDNEVKGEGNEQDYGMRVYDPRLGRFLSVDPLQARYAELTPYQYASNSPIAFLDLDGLERYYYKLSIDSKTGKSTLTHSSTDEREGTLLDALLFRSPSGKKITTKDIYVNVDVDNSYNQTLHFSYFSQLNEWKAKGMPVDNDAGNAEQAAIKQESSVAVLQMQMLTLEQKIDEADGDIDGYAEPSTTGQKTSTSSSTGNQATAANNGNNQASKVNTAAAKKGTANPKVRAAIDLGNKVHYDQMNGGTGIGLPSELSQKYPNTVFRFTSRGAKGADVEVVGGTHPSAYPGSTWNPKNNFADFKPGTPSGTSNFNSEIRNGKLPTNTQKLTYDPVTGKLQ